jgi:hypothetical protein
MREIIITLGIHFFLRCFRLVMVLTGLCPLIRQAILVTLCTTLSSVTVQSTLNTFLYYCQLLLIFFSIHLRRNQECSRTTCRSSRSALFFKGKTHLYSLFFHSVHPVVNLTSGTSSSVYILYII